MVIHENFCPIFNFKMQVVTQRRASEQLCSSTIVTTDATNNIQVSTIPPAPITRQPPHLDENIWNQNLLDRLLEYIRLPREMFWKTSFELLTVLLLVAATRHFVSADCLWEEKVSVFKGSSTTTKNLQYLWWNLKTPYRASKAQIKHQIQGLMVATGEITGFDLAKKKVEICTKKGQKNKMMMMSIIFYQIIWPSYNNRRAEIPQGEESEETPENCLRRSVLLKIRANLKKLNAKKMGFWGGCCCRKCHRWYLASRVGSCLYLCFH